jgi:transcriptional regulator with XRE-family HTH domain
MRHAAGLSQEELGLKVGLHPTHVDGLERGARNPTYETLRKIADGLGTTVGKLATLADEIQAK